MKFIFFYLSASSCLKGALNMAHPPIAVDGIYLYHVKTAGTIVDLSLPQIPICCLDDFISLAEVHCLRRSAVLRSGARLHLDEDQRAAIVGDDIDLPCLHTEIALTYGAAVFREIFRCSLFALRSQYLISHAYELLSPICRSMR